MAHYMTKDFVTFRKQASVKAVMICSEGEVCARTVTVQKYMAYEKGVKASAYKVIVIKLPVFMTLWLLSVY